MKQNFSMTKRSVWFLLLGLAIMILGYIFMIGGGSQDPQVFSYKMFDFRRLVLAPITIISGIVIEILSIMSVFDPQKK